MDGQTDRKTDRETKKEGKKKRHDLSSYVWLWFSYYLYRIYIEICNIQAQTIFKNYTINTQTDRQSHFYFFYCAYSPVTIAAVAISCFSGVLTCENLQCTNLRKTKESVQYRRGRWLLTCTRQVMDVQQKHKWLYECVKMNVCCGQMNPHW